LVVSVQRCISGRSKNNGGDIRLHLPRAKCHFLFFYSEFYYWFLRFKKLKYFCRYTFNAFGFSMKITCYSFIIYHRGGSRVRTTYLSLFSDRTAQDPETWSGNWTEILRKEIREIEAKKGMYEEHLKRNQTYDEDFVEENNYITMEQFKANCTLFYQMLNNSGFNEEESEYISWDTTVYVLIEHQLTLILL